jgi:hypothetical protein
MWHVFLSNRGMRLTAPSGSLQMPRAHGACWNGSSTRALTAEEITAIKVAMVSGLRGIATHSDGPYAVLSTTESIEDSGNNASWVRLSLMSLQGQPELGKDQKNILDLNDIEKGAERILKRGTVEVTIGPEVFRHIVVLDGVISHEEGFSQPLLSSGDRRRMTWAMGDVVQSVEAGVEGGRCWQAFVATCWNVWIVLPEALVYIGIGSDSPTPLAELAFTPILSAHFHHRNPSDA